jgi:hypothetical protein
MVVKTGLLGKKTRNNWKVFECGAGEGWGRSIGPIV